VPDLVLEYHRQKTPIDHPHRSVTREHLEYPTEDVTFAYLATINKTRLFEITVNWGGATLTYDSFVDKAVQTVASAYLMYLFARMASGKDFYWMSINTGAALEDFMIGKTVGGSYTRLATEAVNLENRRSYLIAFSASGSTLKAFRSDMSTPKISATDTDIASGYFGGGWPGNHYAFVDIVSMRLLAPMSPAPGAIYVLEVDMCGSGTDDDPYRPALAKNVVTHDELGTVDIFAITWGAFEFKPSESSTVIIAIYGDNPYRHGAIEKQLQHAKRRYRVRNYIEALEVYRRTRSEHSEWLAGKDNFAYQVLGHEELELFAIADFYYGELVEHRTHYHQLKRVLDWEMQRTLERWVKRLEKVTVLTEERDKHLNKLRKVMKLGW